MRRRGARETRPRCRVTRERFTAGPTGRFGPPLAKRRSGPDYAPSTASRLVESTSLKPSQKKTPTINATPENTSVCNGTAAGYLANGEPFDEVGPVVDALCQIDLPDPERVTQTLFRGQVIHVDAFGTLITNFRRESLGGLAIRRVRVGALVLDQVATVFSDVPEGQPVAYYGSSGRLEVGVNCGNASEDYGMVRGSVVEVEG